ncbi:hypothetical protein DGWBC_0875 [Dehalogenimonas sp. WBC-2]|nr:hypothetical protein DGWBC_0875 [Dehalogenimonas sp. WBC-2]
MKKYLQEVYTFFWVPLILGLVSYVFFQLRDILLGITALVSLSAIYTLFRLYLLHRKVWLLGILACVVLALFGFAFLRTPTEGIFINGLKVTSATVVLNGGTVQLSSSPAVNGDYVKGKIITLTAIPGPGYDWISWTGTEQDTSIISSITIGQTNQIRVTFEPRVALIINNQLVIGSFVRFDEGSITINPAPGADGKYSKGQSLSLTARANSGYDWFSWAGTVNDTFNPSSIVMNGTVQNVSVVFEPRSFIYINTQLVIDSSIDFPQGTVLVNPAPGDDGKYAYGTKVTISAIPSQGYGWKDWSGTGQDTINPTQITINSDKHISIVFEPHYSLSVGGQVSTGTSVNVIGGSVNISQTPGIDGLYSPAVQINITAVPTEGYRFDRWSGDVTGTNSTISLNMNSNKNITPVFIKTFALTVSVSPSDGGTVTIPGTTSYDTGSKVTVTATPKEGYKFEHWEGDASGINLSVIIDMNSNKAATAVFTKIP